MYNFIRITGVGSMLFGFSSFLATCLSVIWNEYFIFKCSISVLVVSVCVFFLMILLTNTDLYER